jgi:hypothetical protein
LRTPIGRSVSARVNRFSPALNLCSLSCGLAVRVPPLHAVRFLRPNTRDRAVMSSAAHSVMSGLVRRHDRAGPRILDHGVRAKMGVDAAGGSPVPARHVSRWLCQGVKESRLINQARLWRPHARLPPSRFFAPGRTRDPSGRRRKAMIRQHPVFLPEAAVICFGSTCSFVPSVGARHKAGKVVICLRMHLQSTCTL